MFWYWQHSICCFASGCLLCNHHKYSIQNACFTTVSMCTKRIRTVEIPILYLSLTVIILMIVMLKWIPKQAGCYSLKWWLLSPVCLFLLKAAWLLYPISSHIPQRLFACLASMAGRGRFPPNPSMQWQGQSPGSPSCPGSKEPSSVLQASVLHLHLFPWASMHKWYLSGFVLSLFKISSSVFWWFLFCSTSLAGT